MAGAAKEAPSPCPSRTPRRWWPHPPSSPGAQERFRESPRPSPSAARRPTRTRRHPIRAASCPTLLALSHNMRQNVYHMDSIERTSAESKGMGVSGVGVLDKSVVILSFLSEGGPATLAEVVGGTGLSRPTAHRLLSALEAHRLVGRSGGRYSLGARLLGWGSRVMDLDLIEAARPVLVALRDETGESTQLYVREGDLRVCVAAVERTGGGLKDIVPVGAVLPLDRGSGGRVLLAWAEDG